jgi:HEAT repeat protein/CHAT domain-containing protein
MIGDTIFQRAKKMKKIFILCALISMNAVFSSLSIAETIHYSGTLTVLETSGQQCRADDKKELQVEMVLNTGQKIKGYFEVVGWPVGKIGGEDKAALQVTYPVYDKVWADGHVLNISGEIGKSLSVGLRRKGLDDKGDGCVFDKAVMSLNKYVSGKDAEQEYERQDILFMTTLAETILQDKMDVGKKEEAKQMLLEGYKRVATGEEKVKIIDALSKLNDKSLTAFFIEALKDTDKRVRYSAAFALWHMKIGDKSAVPALVEALKDTEKYVRIVAAFILGDMGDKRAVPVLIEALKDTNKDVRIIAAFALEEMGDKRAVPALIEALKDTEFDVRNNAASALEKIGDKRAVPVLIEALKDTEPDVRRSAASALGEIGDKRAVPALIEAWKDADTVVRNGAASALGEMGDKRAVPVLIEALKNADTVVRWSAAFALGEIGDKRAVPVLIEALKDTEFDVRKIAASALGEMGDKRAVPVLIEALKDTEPDVRNSAASALEEIGDKRAEPVLVEALKNADTVVRNSAASALGEIGDKRAVPALVEALKDNDTVVRISAASALAKMGDKSGEPVLVEALKNADTVVRNSAASALGEMGDKRAVPALVEALKDADIVVSWRAAFALAKMGDKSAVPALIDALKDSEPDVRKSAAEALEKIGDKSAEPALVEALKDADIVVRFSAAYALGEIGDKSAVPALVKALKDNDTIPSVSWSAAEALGKIGDKSAVSALVEALKDTEFGVRSSAASALGKIGDKSAVPALVEALKDTDKFVRISAASALGEMHVAEPIYKAFVESQEPYLFNILKNEMQFNDDKSLKLLTQSPRPFLKASGYYLLSLKSREDGKFQSQLEYANKALEPIDPKDDTAIAILSLWLKAQAELKLHKPQDALETIKQAEGLLDYLSSKEKNNYQQELFEEQTLFLKGEVYEALNNSKQAIKTYEERLEGLERDKKDWRKSKDFIIRLEAMVQTNLGNLQIKQGKENLEKAVEEGRNYQASDSVTMDNEEIRYTALSKQMIAEGNYEEAQKLLEELNLRRTNYLNRRIDISLADSTKQEFVDEYKKRQNEIESLTRQISEKAGGQKDKELEQQILDKQRELQVYLNGLKKSHPDLAALLGAKPIELKTVQERLPVEVAVLQYLILPDKVIVFVIKNSGIEIVEIPVKKEDLEDAEKQFTAGIRARIGDFKSEAFRSMAIKLNDILIKPIEDSGKLKGITIVGISPNGFLHYVPFGALISSDKEEGTQYLIDRYSLFSINSTSILAVAMDRAEQKTGGRTLLAFGNPDGTLKDSEEEVEGIAKLFDKAEVYNKPGNSKKEIIMQRKGKETFIHLSTHGYFDTLDSSKSYLVMSDGKLTVEDIWGLPLKGMALTTLSACETGLGEILSGDDVVSLENAFIYAGSPSVVSTLWEVDEESTAELMLLFYQDIQKGMTKVSALTDAQRQLRASENYAHPYFWAAFTLRGDWR